MIGKIVLVCVIAIVFYVVIPESDHFVRVYRRKKILDILKGENGVFGSCTGFLDGALTVKPKASSSDTREDIRIDLQKTVFLMLRTIGDLEEIARKTVSLLQSGVTLSYYRSNNRLRRSICLFHEEKNERALHARVSGLSAPRRLPAPLKFFSVASGAFFEFCVLLMSLQEEAMVCVSLAALVAIFGKALPYCPSGLFFTLWAHLVGQKKADGMRPSAFYSLPLEYF